MEFTSWADFHAWALDNGIDREDAYEAWRRAWWSAMTGRSWRYRRKGIKGKRRHYTDASTATEAIAT